MRSGWIPCQEMCLTLLSVLLLGLFFTPSHSTTFIIRNDCPYTVWAAAYPGGGQRLDYGQKWILNVSQGTKDGRIWGRTNCILNASGEGYCQTGDCGGILGCEAFGTPPNTLAEYALSQFGNNDFYDISLVDGFNIPIEFSPTSASCKPINCSSNVNGECPDKLKAPGGCNNPCTVFKTGEYCCNNGSCSPTTYSKYFKGKCPNAYSYPKDDATSTFTCPDGSTNYQVVFCPGGSSYFPLEMFGSEKTILPINPRGQSLEPVKTMARQ